MQSFRSVQLGRKGPAIHLMSLVYHSWHPAITFFTDCCFSAIRLGYDLHSFQTLASTPGSRPPHSLETLALIIRRLATTLFQAHFIHDMTSWTSTYTLFQTLASTPRLIATTLFADARFHLLALSHHTLTEALVSTT
jgi:hypothetical protein